jgi:iron complex transport system ATP-binding protein
MLTITNLHFRYGETIVLRGVDLSIGAGEVVSLVGPNGAGKSTLLKCVNRILSPSEGRIELDGRDTADYRRRDLARAVAFVPQQAGPAMSLPVVDMIGLGRAPHRGYNTAAYDRSVVLDVVEKLNLQSLAFRLFGELSGGERQRVLIARALAQEGRLMLLDEPTTALDLRHQLEMMMIVRSVASERGIAALIAIHDLALASRFSDRLVMLGGGKVQVQGGWKDVLTTSHLEAVYGVSAVVGTDQGMPYVIPTRDSTR